MMTMMDEGYVSYEDLCRQHMEAFMNGVEKFTREMKLGKRVAEWETKIVPVLEEQDRHEEFDIHKNSEELIEELNAKEKKKLPLLNYRSKENPMKYRECLSLCFKWLMMERFQFKTREKWEMLKYG